MRYGAFTHSIALPEVADLAKPEATFENGVVTVKFPKLAITEPKRIEIKAIEPEAKTVG